MTNFRSRMTLGCIAVLSLCVVAYAQGRLKPLVPLPQATPLAPDKPVQPLPPAAGKAEETREGCIVLRDGTVRTGKIVELAAGYQIATQKGTFVFNYDQIRVVADSLPEAYQQIRDSYERPTAAAHLDLGRWCAKNGLMEEALIEAEDALVLEPQRKEAVELLRQAEVALNLAPVNEPPPADRVPVPVTMVSSEAQAEFIRRIQPLALNRCGNGNCHGSGSTSELKLAAVRTGSSPQKVRSEQNLQAILKYIDGAYPSDSRLLVVPRTADGVHDGLFTGNRGTDQYKTLLAWVERVAQEHGQVAARPRRREVADWREGPRLTVRPRPKTAPAEEPLEVEAPAEIETTAAEVVSHEPDEQRSGLRSETVQRLLKNQEPDAFDPEEFNRLVHGTRGSSPEPALPE
jgi:hypothetical protein